MGAAILKPGDLLLAYTDGITEARNVGRGFFSEERLLALLTQPATSAASLLDVLEEAIGHFTGGAVPSDDYTLLALRDSEREQYGSSYCSGSPA